MDSMLAAPAGHNSQKQPGVTGTRKACLASLPPGTHKYISSTSPTRQQHKQNGRRSLRAPSAVHPLRCSRQRCSHGWCPVQGAAHGARKYTLRLNAPARPARSASADSSCEADRSGHIHRRARSQGITPCALNALTGLMVTSGFPLRPVTRTFYLRRGDVYRRSVAFRTTLMTASTDANAR